MSVIRPNSWSVPGYPPAKPFEFSRSLGPTHVLTPDTLSESQYPREDVLSGNGSLATPNIGPTGRSGSTPESRTGSVPTRSNPAAVNIVTGTGALGRVLGLDDDSGLRLGGLWIGDASGVLSGGLRPGKWGLNSLTVIDMYLDAEKLLDWKGAWFGINFLQFSGQPTDILAGAFPGFDSLEGQSPLVRQELYQFWYRQALFDDKLILRVGKMEPTYDFNNVVKPTGDPDAVIPAVTRLVYTPIFVNPTMLGVTPGYYNSATGITTTLAPTKSWYMNYGVFDGNLANGRQTGLDGPHFNDYDFTHRRDRPHLPRRLPAQAGDLRRRPVGADRPAEHVHWRHG